MTMILTGVKTNPSECDLIGHLLSVMEMIKKIIIFVFRESGIYSLYILNIIFKHRQYKICLVGEFITFTIF